MGKGMESGSEAACSHSGGDAGILCMKHNIHMCETCMKCRDPELYCKFRPSCLIWFRRRESGKTDTHLE